MLKLLLILPACAAGRAACCARLSNPGLIREAIVQCMTGQCMTAQRTDSQCSCVHACKPGVRLPSCF